MPAIPGFQVTGPVASSSTTCSWDAVQLSLDRPVCILTPVPGDAASASAFPRVEALARVFARIAHGDVVQVIDVARSPDGLPYVVLEKLDGSTLGAAIREGGPMEPARALAIVSRLGSALSALWDRSGIVFRNLKSASIVLLPGDVPKIAAFHSADMPGASAALPPDGATLVGTPQYMAPEQTDGVSPIDWRADLYAAGALLYEMLTGRPPFAWAADPMEILRLQREASEPAPSDVQSAVSPGCSRILSRMMAKRPEDRYASWAEALADISAVAAGGEPAAASSGGFPSTIAAPSGAPVAEGADSPRPAPKPAARVTLKPRLPVAMPPSPAPTERTAPAAAPESDSAPVQAPKRIVVMPLRQSPAAAGSGALPQKTAKIAPAAVPAPSPRRSVPETSGGGTPVFVKAACMILVPALFVFVAWMRVNDLERSRAADSGRVSAPPEFTESRTADDDDGGFAAGADGDTGFSDDAVTGISDGDDTAAAPGGDSVADSGTGDGAADGAGTPDVAEIPADGEPQVDDAVPSKPAEPPSFARRYPPASPAGRGVPPNPFKNRGRGTSRRVVSGGTFSDSASSLAGSASPAIIIAAMNAADDSASRPASPPPPAPDVSGPEEEVVEAVAKYLVRWVREQPCADTFRHAQSFLRASAEKRADIAKRFKSLANPFRQAETFEDLVGHALSKSPAEREIPLGGMTLRIRPSGYASPVLVCDIVGKNGQVSKNRKLSLDKMTDPEKYAVVSSLAVDRDPGALASRALLILRCGTAEEFREFVRRHKLVDLAPLARAVGGEAGAEGAGRE